MSFSAFGAHGLHRHGDTAKGAPSGHLIGLAGGDGNGRRNGLHNCASAPTLYYGSSQRPLQVQAPHVLVERFSSPAPNTAEGRPSSAQPPQHDSQPGAPSNSFIGVDTHQQPDAPAAPLPAQPAGASQPSAGCSSTQEPATPEMSLDPATMLYKAGELLIARLVCTLSW